VSQDRAIGIYFALIAAIAFFTWGAASWIDSLGQPPEVQKVCPPEPTTKPKKVMA
jgi:hypothetical protein